MARALNKDDELELAFLDSDPKQPRRSVAKEIRPKKAAAKPPGDLRLLGGIIHRHCTGLWATVALVELAIIVWLKHA